MLKTFLVSIFFLVLILLSYIYKSEIGTIDLYQDPLFLGVIGSITGAIISFVILNFDIKNLVWLYYSIVFYRRRVRFSISYLFRIKVDGIYFLIKGTRIENQYQPVGGVYKYYDASRKTLNSMSVLDDDLIGADRSSTHDLRVRVPGKFIWKFMKWFNSGMMREKTPIREFKEELVNSRILSKKNFDNIHYEFINRKKLCRYSEWAQSFEIIIADIYELIPNESQTTELRGLISNNTKKYIWVNSDVILRRGAVAGEPTKLRIPITATWTL